MAIEKNTIVDQVEVTRDGHVQIRLGLLLIDDGKEVSCEWHRTAIEPGGDVDAQIKAVNRHLQQTGKRPVTEGLQLIRDIARLVHTADVVKKFRGK